jgi:S1-C subfamily serine protease
MVKIKQGFVSAQLVKYDAANDIALLKASMYEFKITKITKEKTPITSNEVDATQVVRKFPILPIISSSGEKLGGLVATVGFPSIGLQGFSPKLAKGEIASLSGAGDDPRYFQISVPVQPGNSGGALVDAHGNVVGIVAAKLSAQAALDATGQLPENVNYAVKSSLLLSFLESVPEVASKLKEPNAKDAAFEDVVKSAQDAAVLVLVY